MLSIFIVDTKKPLTNSSVPNVVLVLLISHIFEGKNTSSLSFKAT